MPRIFAALDESGRPLLARVYGGVPPPSFPTVALLSSLFSYGENVGVALREISTSDARLVFKRTGESLLVLVTNEQASTEEHNLHLLQIVYDAVILTSGRESLEGPGGGLPMPDTPHRDVDAIKKVFRGATPLIDYLLQEENRPLGIQLQMPEVAYVEANKRQLVEECLSKLSESISTSRESMALAITWKGAIVAATPQLLKQNAQDLVLLQALIRCLPPATLRDTPVYLPNSNPDVPIRLLTAELLDGMELVILTGPTPSISMLPALVQEHLGHAYGVLQEVADSISTPSSLPPGMEALEAIVAIRQSPPRCMAVTSAASEGQSGYSPFDARGTRVKQQRHWGVKNALVSFALCVSPMIPLGYSKDGEAVQASLPKRSDAEMVQMTTSTHRLICMSDESDTGLRIYAAATHSIASTRALDAASAALRSIPGLLDNAAST